MTSLSFQKNKKGCSTGEATDTYSGLSFLTGGFTMQVVTPIASDRKRVLKLLCIGFGALLAMASPKKSGTAGLRTLLVCFVVVLCFPAAGGQETRSGRL